MPSPYSSEARNWQSPSPRVSQPGLEVANAGSDLPEVVPQDEKFIQVLTARPSSSLPSTTYRSAHNPYGDHDATRSDVERPLQNGAAGEAGLEKSVASTKRETICGFKRRTFFYLLAAIFFVAIATLGGVLGGVLTSSRNNNSDSASSPQSATTSPSPTRTTTITSSGPTTPTTTTRSSASANPTFVTTSGPGGVHIECPAADGERYTHADTGKVFRRECNRNYVGGDVHNLTATDFEECIDACAEYAGCLGANWMYRGEQGTANNYCWIKTTLNSGIDDSGCESAVLMQD
ncbi:uncharacterized protein BCR38DRAFT_446856 [Pseudomassariella vexata]|uniref:Apple domain-containing protein n=1 Tax=Pseudomassariella vexata TaxID=1141098 RepID=A0A1Y2DI99_9PEZI|nr:uncharacterized protein BCR38DRAFT_446856 [Pseudomassariella vexata]ORY58876.1 hypothetical protein BCR38DRAFT_446856 [Pseudomassariella vexata]